MTEADGVRAESTDPMLQVVREYIQKFKYGIASTEDFWDSVDAVVREDALDEETSETVRGLRTFTRSRGYPLLTLSIEDGGDAELLVLSQRPFGNGTLLADARAAARRAAPPRLAGAPGLGRARGVAQHDLLDDGAARHPPPE